MNRQKEKRESSRELSTNVGEMNSAFQGAAVALKSPDLDYMHDSIRSMSPDFDFGTSDFLCFLSLLVQDFLIRPRPITITAFENKPLHLGKLTTGRIGGRRSEQAIAHGYDRGRSRAFEATIKQQEYGISPESKHY